MLAKKETLCLVLAATALYGCNDSWHESEHVSLKSAKTDFVGDGVYYDMKAQTAVLIDSTRKSDNIVIMDGSDKKGDSEELLYFADKYDLDRNHVYTNKLTYTEHGSVVSKKGLHLKATYKNDEISIFGRTSNEEINISGKKQPSSFPLSKIVGTKSMEVSNGTLTWTIDKDGTFTINSVCIINGKLKRHGDYFDMVDVSATSCENSKLNGENTYSGVMFTLGKEDNYALIGLLKDKSNLMHYVAN